MVELYRPPHSRLADEVEETLRDIVIAHRVVVVEPGTAAPVSGPLPALRHDDVVTGEAEIRDYLEKLRRLMEDWSMFQSDACYVGRDGSIC